ncbi:hypothetical protein ALC152_05870 [Arcobacter sp. 15-2]|uniref:hypothetical protein n=1 Tax=Arcobacter sp. 15-2 TaxID=3374109 RepID=UPI0021C52433
MSTTTEIEKIALANTKKGVISVSHITEPYGAGSGDVTSIGISLTGKEPEWKVHIPKENVDALIAALEKSK